MSSKKAEYKFPYLYGKDKQGRLRVWKVWVVKNKVYKSYGLMGMKLTIAEPRTYKGVNIGRSNETTPNEQAMREAERDWIRQLDKKYWPKTKRGKIRAKAVMAQKREQGNTNAQVTTMGKKSKSVK